jgi:DNA-binding transcriptional MerR regulator
MRIGEVARITGIPPATLRVWERRYGVLRPERTPGGHRVYSAADVARVRALLMRIEGGVSVSAAARAVLDGRADTDAEGLADAMSKQAWQAVEAFDAAALRRAVAVVGQGIGVAAALDLLVVPILHRLGDEWRRSDVNVAREHFASTVLRSVLLQHLPGRSGAAPLPMCVLFCPEGELHDLGVVMAAATMAEAGWQPIVLGAHTPWVSVEAIIRELRPDALLVGAQRRPPALRLLGRWDPPSDAAVVLGGVGFRDEDAADVRGTFVHHGPYRELVDAVGGARRARPAALIDRA